MTRKQMTVPLGPLRAERYQDGVDDVWEVFEEGGRSCVAQIRFWDEPDYPEVAVKAKELAELFAASLDMLDALIVAESHLRLVQGELYVHSRCSEKLRRAVARATGGRLHLGKKFKLTKRNYSARVSHAVENMLEHFLPQTLQEHFEEYEAPRRGRIFKDIETVRKWLLHRYRTERRDQAAPQGGPDE
jgi:hypothetical protein